MMEINLGEEKIVELVSPFAAEVVQDRIMARRMDAFGQLARLMQRPKAEEIVVSQSEKRYEPFWFGAASAHYSYDRRRKYSVEVAPEVQTVTLYDKDHEVMRDRGRYFTLEGMEHCAEDIHRQMMLDPVRGDERDFSRYMGFNKREVDNLEALRDGGAVVVPPEVRSSFLVRKLLQTLMKTFQADKIFEERIDVDQVALYYHPVYAFEFHWVPKDKRTILEFDGLTGEIRAEGGQIKKQMVSVLENDALFDIGADAIGTFLPGANIAVKVGRMAARKAIK
jgi:hypothetical protein